MVSYYQDNASQDDDDNVSVPGTLLKFLTGTYLVRKLLVPYFRILTGYLKLINFCACVRACVMQYLSFLYLFLYTMSPGADLGFQKGGC